MTKAKSLNLPTATKIIVILNNKGGVGKTTATVHLGVALAELGRKVLCVDMDSQGNLTQNFFSRSVVNREIKPESINAPLPPKTHHSGVDVLTLSFFETDVASYVEIIHQEAKQYDIVLIDSPPSLKEIRSHAGLQAADSVIIPTEAEQFSISGITPLLNIAQERNLRVLGIFVNKFDTKKLVHKTFDSFIAEHYAQAYLGVVIPPSTLFPNSQAENKTGFDVYYTPKSKKNSKPVEPHAGLEAYRKMAQIISH